MIRREPPLTMGFTIVSALHGSLERDVGIGDGRENPPRAFRSEEDDQGRFAVK
jgi:hypothetical protein